MSSYEGASLALALTYDKKSVKETEVLRVLNLAPHLERLGVKHWCGSFSRNFDNLLFYPRPPTTYPSLRHLKLKWNPARDAGLVFPVLLGSLTLPYFETLHILAKTWIDNEVIALLERSQCSLKSLAVLDSAQRDLSASLRFSSVTRLLGREDLLSSLEELIINRSCLDSGTIDNLTVDHFPFDPTSPAIRFPALRRIRFSEGMAYTNLTQVVSLDFWSPDMRRLE